MMKTKDSITLAAILLVATTLTLLTSLEHHRTISTHYGLVARVFDPLIAISSFILGAIIALLFQWGINVIQFEHIMKLLPANERTVLKALFKKRTITQMDLTAITGLPRLMISRIISNLEEKGVVTKKPLATVGASNGKNTNLIESRLYGLHPSTHLLTRLPGLSEKRLIAVIAIVFLFGISFSFLNSFHILVLEHPLRPAMYLIAIEFFALGGLTNVLLRKRIANMQFERILMVLPEDEREILRTIHTSKTMTQRDLVGKTGLYKMKVSRIIRKFEQKGIVDRKPYGYTNVIISKL